MLDEYYARRDATESPSAIATYSDAKSLDEEDGLSLSRPSVRPVDTTSRLPMTTVSPNLPETTGKTSGMRPVHFLGSPPSRHFWEMGFPDYDPTTAKLYKKRSARSAHPRRVFRNPTDEERSQLISDELETVTKIMRCANEIAQSLGAQLQDALHDSRACKVMKPKEVVKMNDQMVEKLTSVQQELLKSQAALRAEAERFR